MIFSTIDTQLTGINNKIALFGKSLNDISRDFSSGHGVYTSLFSNTVTQDDVTRITDFMHQLQTGVPIGQAWSSTMAGATVAGKQMAVQVKSGAVSLNTLTASANTSKVAMVGLKIAATALNIALTMGLSFAIQKLVEGFDYLVHYADNVATKSQDIAQASKQAADAQIEEYETLDKLIQKYKELAESETQDASTRSEIRAIQEEIAGLVGTQADNLDLVNGKLNEQLTLLYEIQSIELDDAVSSAKKAYTDARDAANNYNWKNANWYSDAVYNLADPDNQVITIDYWGDNKGRNKALDIIDKAWQEAGYGRALVGSMGDGLDTFSMLTFDAELNIQERLDALNAAIDALENADGFDYLNNGLWKALVDLRDAVGGKDGVITKQIESANSLLDIVSQQTIGSGKKNVNSLDEYIAYRQEIIDSILDDDAIKQAINDGVLSEDTYIEKVGVLEEAFKSLQDGEFGDSDFVDLVKQFPELADNANDLDSAILDLLATMNTDITSEFASQFGKMDTDEDVLALVNFQNAVLALGEAVGNTSFSINIAAETEGIQAVLTAMKESVSSTGLTADSIKELKARYQDLEGYDAARLFERTANGIHLNTKALRELESAYETQKKQAINDDLNGLVDQYNDLTTQINETSDAAQKAELYAQRSEILDQIHDTADLAAQYEGLTSAFYKWEQAQSIGEEGDMYDSLAGSLENIKELYKEGLIGTNKFRTAVQLMSNEDLSTASIDELLAAYDTGYAKMTRYFTDSSDGCLNFLNDVQDLNSEWAKMNSDGSWEINFGVGNDQEIADALNINVESVQAIMRKLSDYGFDINLDSMYSSLNFLQSEAEKANAKLIELGKTDVVFNFDTTDLDDIYGQINQAQSLLDTFKNSDGSVNLEMEGAEEAIQILLTLISYRQQLDVPSIILFIIRSQSLY